MGPRSVYLPLFLAAFTFIATLGSIVGHAQAVRSTRDGVYTAAQADRGKQVFDEQCIACHTAQMWGSDWTGKSAFDAVDYIRQYMPEPAPDSLTPQQAADLLAFFLRGQALPPGGTELPAAQEGLKAIQLEKPR